MVRPNSTAWHRRRETLVRPLFRRPTTVGHGHRTHTQLRLVRRELDGNFSPLYTLPAPGRHQGALVVTLSLRGTLVALDCRQLRPDGAVKRVIVGNLAVLHHMELRPRLPRELIIVASWPRILPHGLAMLPRANNPGRRDQKSMATGKG